MIVERNGVVTTDGIVKELTINQTIVASVMGETQALKMKTEINRKPSSCNK